MYDNDYFKEVMGSQYKENDLYENTYNRNNHNYVVITPNDDFNRGNYNSTLVNATGNGLNSNKEANVESNVNQKSLANNGQENNENLVSKNATVVKENSEGNKISKANNQNGERSLETKDILKNARLENETKEVNFGDLNSQLDDNDEKTLLANNRLNEKYLLKMKAEKDLKEAENKITNEVKEASTNIKKDFDKYYPEIYRIIDPMIDIAINRNSKAGITGDVLEKIANEIYYAIEGYEGNMSLLVSKNQNSSILYDLIKILLLDRAQVKMNNIPNINKTNNSNSNNVNGKREIPNSNIKNNLISNNSLNVSNNNEKTMITSNNDNISNLASNTKINEVKLANADTQLCDAKIANVEKKIEDTKQQNSDTIKNEASVETKVGDLKQKELNTIKSEIEKLSINKNENSVITRADKEQFAKREGIKKDNKDMPVHKVSKVSYQEIPIPENEL